MRLNNYHWVAPKIKVKIKEINRENKVIAIDIRPSPTYPSSGLWFSWFVNFPVFFFFFFCCLWKVFERVFLLFKDNTTCLKVKILAEVAKIWSYFITRLYFSTSKRTKIFIFMHTRKPLPILYIWDPLRKCFWIHFETKIGI